MAISVLRLVLFSPSAFPIVAAAGGIIFKDTGGITLFLGVLAAITATILVFSTYAFSALVTTTLTPISLIVEKITVFGFIGITREAITKTRCVWPVFVVFAPE